MYNQEVGECSKTKQDAKLHRNRGYIGDRSSNLIKLIGVERVSRRDFKYEGTYYVTEDGEVCDKKYVIPKKAQRTGINFYEVTDWEYDERRKLNLPTIRRIVIIKNDDTQLSLNL